MSPIYIVELIVTSKKLYLILVNICQLTHATTVMVRVKLIRFPCHLMYASFESGIGANIVVAIVKYIQFPNKSRTNKINGFVHNTGYGCTRSTTPFAGVCTLRSMQLKLKWYPTYIEHLCRARAYIHSHVEANNPACSIF